MPVRDGEQPKVQNQPRQRAEVKKATVAEPKKETVQKFVIEERVKKYLEGINPELVPSINETLNREVIDKTTKEKNSVCFVVFSTNGEKDEMVDEDYNIACIKDVLFHYHTAEEKQSSGKALMVEVLPPAGEDEVTMLCFHEVQ